MNYDQFLAQIFRMYFDQIAVESIEKSFEEIKEELKEWISDVYSLLELSGDDSKKKFLATFMRFAHPLSLENFDKVEKNIIIEVILEQILGDPFLHP